MKACLVIILNLILQIQSQALLASSGDTYRVTTSDLNVRSGAGNSYYVVDKLHYGDEVELIDNINDEWYEVKYANTSGYVYSKYLMFSSSKQELGGDEAVPEKKTGNLFSAFMTNIMSGYSGIFVIVFIIGIIIILVSVSNKGWMNENSKSDNTRNYSSVEVNSRLNSENVAGTKYVVMISPKSKGIAILLVLIFGPLGLFYSTIKGALIMTFVVPISITIIFLFFLFNMNLSSDYNLSYNEELLAIVGGGFAYFFGFLAYWVICIVWAVNAVGTYNTETINQLNQQ